MVALHLQILIEMIEVSPIYYLRKVHTDGVVVPLVVAHLRQLPAPFSRLELVKVTVRGVLLAEEKHELTVMDKERVVVTVHTCTRHTMTSLQRHTQRRHILVL